MKTELSLVTVAPAVMPVYSLTAEARQVKETALQTAALIGKVTNAAENTLAVNAQRELKRVSLLFEKQRKILKEPLLEAGRQLDRTVAAELAEIEQEAGRITNLVTQFAVEEQRRVREEEELQRKRLEEIERQKQAELAKAKTDQQKASIEEKAAAAAHAESRPIQATREVGQVVKTDWEITVINPYELAKYHPDCVKVEPLLTPIKNALNEGREIKGIRATKITKASVRTGQAVAALDV